VQKAYYANAWKLWEKPMTKLDRYYWLIYLSAAWWVTSFVPAI